MKKILSITLTLAMVFSAVAAFATPSKSTDDLITTGDSNVSGVLIYVSAAPNAVAAAAAVTEDLGETLATGAPAVEHFDEEVQADITAALPAGVEASSLVCNELVPLGVSGYEEGMGDIISVFQFATVYTPNQTVIPVLGFVDAEGNVQWHVLKAQVYTGGFVYITFPAELILRMTTETSVLAILSV